MFSVDERVKEEILQHTINEYPKEMCGVIVDKEDGQQFIPIPNITKSVGQDERDSFVMCPRVYSSVDEHNKIVAIVHSHPDDTSYPSDHDKMRCNQGELPWVIMSYPDVDMSVTYPEETPLIGRPFVHGVTDCWSLVRDFYKQEYNIHLRDYEREDEWWMKGQDMYIENLDEEGFIEITREQLQIGDVLFMQLESPVTNHAAVLVDDGIILHHLYGRPSAKGRYGGYWIDRTTRFLRHRERDKQLPKHLRVGE